MEKSVLEQLSNIQFQFCSKSDDHHMLGKVCLDQRCRKINSFFEPICEACEIEETHKLHRDIHKTEDLRVFLVKICRLCYKTKDEEIQESRNEKLKQQIEKTLQDYKKSAELIHKLIANLETLLENYNQIIYSNKDYINDQLYAFCEQQKVDLKLIENFIYIDDDQQEPSIRKVNQLKIRDQEHSIRENLEQMNKFLSSFENLTNVHSNIFSSVKSFEEREVQAKNDRLKELNIIMKDNWIRKSYKNGEFFGEVKYDKMHYGDLRHCKRHGFGIFLYNDGDRYQGQYVDGERTGQGIYFYANGNRYEGDFIDGKFEGKGKYFYKNGDMFEGIFKDGKSIKLKQIN